MVGAQIIVQTLTMFLSFLCIFMFVFFMSCLLFSADRFLFIWLGKMTTRNLQIDVLKKQISRKNTTENF